MLRVVDTEADINKINDYFSYEHFYVLYCKFWELDTDHDFLLDRDDGWTSVWTGGVLTRFLASVLAGAAFGRCLASVVLDQFDLDQCCVSTRVFDQRRV